MREKDRIQDFFQKLDKCETAEDICALVVKNMDEEAIKKSTKCLYELNSDGTYKSKFPGLIGVQAVRAEGEIKRGVKFSKEELNEAMIKKAAYVYTKKTKSENPGEFNFEKF